MYSLHRKTNLDILLRCLSKRTRGYWKYRFSLSSQFPLYQSQKKPLSRIWKISFAFKLLLLCMISNLYRVTPIRSEVWNIYIYIYKRKCAWSILRKELPYNPLAVWNHIPWAGEQIANHFTVVVCFSVSLLNLNLLHNDN